MATIRTFIALEVNNGIKKRAVALQEQLAESGTPVKWVEEENVHLTLLFLGEVDEREVVEVCREVKRVASGFAPFTITVEKVGCFPNTRRPRVVWMGVEEEREIVVALHDALELAMLDLGCYRREARQYTPHITLGRVQGSVDTSALASVLAGKADWKGGETVIKELTVFSSELRSRGPIYSPLSRVKLAGH